MSGSILGAAVRRREDPRLITGRGAFVDDLVRPGCLHAVFVRSPHAAARILDLDLASARATPGVVGVFAAADLGLEARQTFPLIADSFARPPLAGEEVRFAGEAVAVVVAESRGAAADAAQLAMVNYEPRPALVGAEAAVAEGAPLLFPEHGSNVAFEDEYGAHHDVLAGADVVVRARFRNQRLAGVPLEAGAVLAEPDPETSGLRLYVSTQSPFQVRDFVAESLGFEEGAVRCIAPDVGGGFGSKLAVYPEQAVVAALARRLGRPVRWVETRAESMVAMTQGRDQVQDVALAATRDGRVLGLRADVLADAGAYPGLGAILPMYTGQLLSGVYTIPRIHFRARSVCTNTTPVSAYRGAGRPEATALIERAMDMLAAEVGLDPAEVRRRNLIPAGAFPHETAAGATYDSGDYAAALALALDVAGYSELRREQKRRREVGERRVLGVGLSTYVEITAAGSPTEYASVEALADGAFTVLVGTAAHGQGHATAFAQIAAATLDVSTDSIEVVEGDTGRVPRGDGTSASRSVQLGGSAVLEASRALLESGRRLAAELLEADANDLAPGPQGIGVRGSPGAVATWAALSAASRERGEGALREEVDVMAEPSYPFGAHVAMVEVDLDTGDARALRHVAVDDCGTVVNPLLVAGQVQGGVAQGLGQALYEEVVHDPAGNPVSASLLDYVIPSAAEMPALVTAHTITPSPHNPLGAKGVGESGTIGSTPAVQNAVVDALAHLGVRHLDMPATPERVWRALNALSQPPQSGPGAGPRASGASST
ncbi:MAG: xanthine dehydrogenase family protein molybdopterin-binding subunit [Candidatus Dormibacteraeota bacterium]|nr:xanthine dehydrogenase family protein molybdopterin-binding subunit [Candidatus Dormibacteraeota bacterium]